LIRPGRASPLRPAPIAYPARYRAFVAISSVVLALAVTFVGCGAPPEAPPKAQQAPPNASPKAQPELIEKVRQEVAKSLKKEAAQIDVHKPLGDQGADELDIVELVIAVEETFNVEIPVSATGDQPGELQTLTIQKLADTVAGQMEKNRSGR